MAEKDGVSGQKSVAYRMLALEVALVSLAAILLLLTADAVTALSVVIGGLAFVVPNAYFARYVFRYSAAESAELAVRGFYIGELVKIVATVMIFGLAFALADGLKVVAVFVTYVVLILINLWGNSVFMSH